MIVTATDQENQTGQATSNAVGPVTNPPPPHNMVAPAISGTTQDGQTLTASRGKWSSPDPLTFTYQWQRCDSDGTNCVDVPASGHPYTYKLSSADIGHLIQVIVTATDQENQTRQATSNAVGPVTDSGV